jgi:long-chain acyl-CoA synthetase
VISAQARGLLPVLLGSAVATSDLLGEAASAAGELGEPCMVLPTSGTTSAPRAVLRTAASWTASFTAFSQVSGIGPRDVVWVPGGAGSTLTLFGVWHAEASGLPVVATGAWRGVPAASAADPRVTEASVVQCVPPVFEDVVTAVERGDLPRLRLAVVAGAALPVSLRGRAHRAGLDVVEYYGAAELSFVAMGRAGLRPFPGVDVVSRDGVLWCRSEYVAARCLGPAGAFRREEWGWASVGDRGHVGPDGVVTVLGRDAALLVGGSVVLAGDVEQVLGAVPGVRDVVCLAGSDPRLGERVVLVVEPLAPGRAAPEVVADLRSAARAGLPLPARPVRYVVRQGLPRTPGGKVARAELARPLGLRVPGPAAGLDLTPARERAGNS